MVTGTLFEAALKRSRRATGLLGASSEAIEAAHTVGKASGRLAMDGTKVIIHNTPAGVLTATRAALRRVGIIEPVAATPEEQYRNRLDMFQDSMALRVAEYERNYERRFSYAPDVYKMERKLGVVRDTLFDDARKWMEIAREEEDPDPTAGTSEEDRINNIAACAVGWGLSHEATEELVGDLYEYFEVAIPIGGTHDDTPKLGSVANTKLG